MDPSAYYGITITLYLCEMALCFVIPGVGILFDFISVFSISSILFIFPGLFYFLCEKKYVTGSQDKFKHIMSIAYMITGVLVAIFILVNTCITLSNL